jgi:predicted DCC family thiol-disulfide oxidoreductase YuxK
MEKALVFIYRRWQDYWFRKDGILSIGICRIAVFASLLFTHHKVVGFARPSYEVFLANKEPGLYKPLGILKLFGDTVPSASFFEVCQYTALISTYFAIVGLFTRISMPISVLTNLVLVSIIYAWDNYWSHGYNVVFLVGIAFMFGRAGDSLSLDAVIKSIFNKKPFRGPGLEQNYRYQWSVFLAQFAAALMFAMACYWKLHSDDFRLGWALSDNLRNALAWSWYRYRSGPPAYVAWIMSHDVVWKALALGNIIAQGTVILACFLVRHPLWRFIFGSLFFLETLGLGIVMGLWNPPWFPLTALFIDWDRLLPWLGHKLKPIRQRFTVTVYYDGICGLCNRTMHVINTLDWLRLVNYKPIQVLEEEDLPPGGTIEKLTREMGVVAQGQLSYGFKGYVRLLCHLPLTMLIALPFSLIMYIPPISYIGNRVYRWVAKNRLFWFGCVDNQCEIPTSSVAQTRTQGTRNVLIKDIKNYLLQGVASVFILLFIGYDLYIGIANAGMAHRNYPFTSWLLYSDIKAKKPYNQNAPFEYIGDRIKITTNQSQLSNSQLKKIRRKYQSFYAAKDVNALRLRMSMAMKDLKTRYKIKDIEKITVNKVIWQVPAYPADHNPIPVHEAAMGVLYKSGEFYSAAGRVKIDSKSGSPFIDIRLTGYKNPKIRFGYWLNLSGDIRPIEGKFVGRKFYFVPKEPGLYNLVIFVSEPIAKEQAYFGPEFEVESDKITIY